MSDAEQTSVPLGEQLSALARDLQAEPDSAAVLDRIVHAAASDIPGTEAAGVTIARRNELRTEARTSDLVDRLDQVQYDVQQGPCVQSSWQHETVRSDDLNDEQRWPAFAHAAVELGIRSVLSVQLFVHNDSMGALNLYGSRPSAFDREAENIALLFGAHAAVALADARRTENLRIALASREVIGEAKGILMERYKVSSNQAFDLLIMASQRSHRKLREVAEALTMTGELPVPD